MIDHAPTAAGSLMVALHTRFEANNAEYERIDGTSPDGKDFAEQGRIDRARTASQREEDALRHAILTQVPRRKEDALILVFHIRLEQDFQASAAQPVSEADAGVLSMAIDTLFDFLACELQIDHEALGPRLQDACTTVFSARRYRTGYMEA